MDDMKIRGSMAPLGDSLKLPKFSDDKSQGPSFADTLSESLQEVNGLQHGADRAIEDLVTGKSKSIHDTMITLSKAELAPQDDQPDQGRSVGEA